jgi:ligand-binding sensor domain-containing protein
MKRFIAFLFGILAFFSTNVLNAQSFTNYTTANGLPDNNVNGVAIDAGNNKWFGTQSGVAKYDDATWTIYTTAQGVVDNYINCIAVDKNNHVWVGTDLGVSMYNGTNWTTYTTAQGLVDNSVNYIAGDSLGKVWFTTTMGVSVFDGTTWTTYTTANGLPDNTASFVIPDASGNVWIGTWMSGLVKFNGSTFQTYTSANDSLVSDNIVSVAINAPQYKWVGTFSGISVLDDEDAWVRDYTITDGLYNNFVQDLDFDSGGNLWVGMYANYNQDGGISVFTGTNWYSYTVTDGLIDPQVKRLAIDHQDNIWITTGSGVSKLLNPILGTSDILTGKQAAKIYPNPASDYVRVDHSSPVALEILDLTGKTLVARSLPLTENSIDIRQLNPGVYIVRMTDDAGTNSTKLIVR